jgi:hypothetical protein
MPMTPIFLFVVFAAIALVMGLYAHRKQAARQAALAQLAQELGWQFDPGRDKHFSDRYPHVPLFSRGHSRFAHNRLQGALEIAGQRWPVQLGDYHYQVTSNSGKSQQTTTHRFSFLLVQLPFGGVPSVSIRKEHFFDRLASAVGFDDIDFESAEFSRRFHVKSDDKRFAYDLIHPRMMEFLLTGEPPAILLQGVDGCLYTADKCWSPETCRGQLAWCQAFFELWPEHVTTSLPS